VDRNATLRHKSQDPGLILTTLKTSTVAQPHVFVCFENHTTF